MLMFGLILRIIHVHITCKTRKRESQGHYFFEQWFTIFAACMEEIEQHLWGGGSCEVGMCEKLIPDNGSIALSELTPGDFLCN